MKTLRWLIAVLVVAAVTHGALLYLGPSLVMSAAMGRVGAAAPLNDVLHAERPNADNDVIVRSSPDLLYDICIYDIRERPLRISATTPPGTYWSVSFYDMNTNNFRVINDGQASAGAVLLVLDKVGREGPAPAGAEIVVSPTDRGIVLFRTLVNDESRLAEIDAVRRSASCAPL